MQPVRKPRATPSSVMGTVAGSWVTVVLALLLLVSITGLEGMLYRETGGGFLLP